MLKERLVKLAGDLQPNEFALLYPHGITITRIIGDKEISRMVTWLELESATIDIGLLMLDRMRREGSCR